MARHKRTLHSQTAAASLSAVIVPSTCTRRMLHEVIVTDGHRVITQQPLPYGSPLPHGADAELRGLGFTRLESWQPQDEHWHTAVEPLT